MAKKRTVTCGKCKEEGHNARTCPNGTKATSEVKKGQITKTEVELPDPPKTQAPKPEDEPRPRRAAPTADTGTAATASPFRCPKCNQVAILAIVRVKDHNESFKKKRDVFKGDTRCEKCLNKPDPAELILVWGASPNQKVPAEVANAATDG